MILSELDYLDFPSSGFYVIVFIDQYERLIHS